MSALRRSGPARARLRLPAIALLAGLLLIALGTFAAAQEAADGPLIEVVELDGYLDRQLVDHLADTLAAAEGRGAEVVLVTVDSPGALGVGGQELVDLVAQSPVPVAVWVGPTGARATSGAAVLAASAHVLAVAPGTSYGAALPADLRAAGTLTDPALEAQLVELAERHGRVTGSAQAVVTHDVVYATLPDGAPAELGDDARLPTGVDRLDILAVSESDILERGIVDVVGLALDDVLRELDGREVTLAGGTTQTLDVDPATSRVRFSNPGLIARVLHAVATPALAYLLIVSGLLCLVFELYQPGFGVSGWTGVALAAFGAYGLAVLPTSWLGLVVLLVGLALLSADLAVGGLGLLTAGGAAAFAAGSWLLFDGPAVVRLPAWLVALVTFAVVAFFVVIMTIILRSQNQQAMAGAEQVVGKEGVVRSTLNPGGHVFVDGALWRARGPEDAGKIRTGTPIRVVGLNEEQSLDVELVDEPAPTP